MCPGPAFTVLSTEGCWASSFLIDTWTTSVEGARVKITCHPIPKMVHVPPQKAGGADTRRLPCSTGAAKRKIQCPPPPKKKKKTYSLQAKSSLLPDFVWPMSQEWFLEMNVCKKNLKTGNENSNLNHLKKENSILLLIMKKNYTQVLLFWIFSIKFLWKSVFSLHRYL